MPQRFQASAVDTLQANAVADGQGTTGNTGGYEFIDLFVSNGAGTCTVTLKQSLDSTFAIAQDASVPGVVKLWDSAGGTNTSRTVLSGVIPIAANTSYRFGVADVHPYTRAVISGSSGLGAGTNVTGCTAKLYKMGQ